MFNKQKFCLVIKSQKNVPILAITVAEPPLRATPSGTHPKKLNLTISFVQ